MLMGEVLDFKVSPGIQEKRFQRIATKEAEHLYHITGGFVETLQDPAEREAWEEGLLER